jgi:archaellum component FlaF (FlaF/FlaG flagellin family)
LGFSVAAAAAILFAGGLVSFTIVLQAMDSAQQDVRDARAVEDRRTQELANTRVNLINGSANGTAVELNLTNNGSVIIHVNTLEVLVNGTLYTANVTLRAVNGAATTKLWAPGQTLHLVVAAPVPGPAGVKLVTDTGYSFQGTVS